MEMSIASENRRLREIVQQLLERIDENQKTQKHFHAFELKVLDAISIHELLYLLLDESCRHFRLACASLLLLDEDGKLESLFDSTQVGNFHNRLQLRQSPDFYQKIYPADPRVMLQEVDVLTATRLFPGTPKVGSAAFLPIVFRQRVVGSLHFASSESERFNPNKGTELLEHMAAVISVCLNHCIDREARELLQEIDPKTQMGSDRYFQRAFNRELERTAVACGHLACVVVELAFSEDDLQQWLPEIAMAVKGAVRKVDLCAKNAEQSLVVLLPDADSRQAQATAARVQKALADIERLPHAQVKVGANAWKARKTKNPSLDVAKLAETGRSLIEQAALNAEAVK